MSEQFSFLKPRMAGRRFDDHAIPLEMLKDLSVLEEMIVEVAKWHYLNDHPERARSPKGFANGISIKLTDIAKGSAMPDMSLFVEQPQLVAFQNQDYFERAKNSIVNAIEAAELETKIQDHLPESFLSYFDKLGRGLRENEYIDFAPDSIGRSAKLNKTTRRRLMLASSQMVDLTDEVTLRGVIPEADQAKLSFELVTISGQKVTGPIPAQHHETIITAFNGYQSGLRVSIQGIARYNRHGQLKSLEEIEHVTLLDKGDVAARIDELRLLEKGWLDGAKGHPLNSTLLSWLEQQLDTHISDPLPSPYLYPTVEGGVQIEWSIGDYEITLEVDLIHQLGHMHALNMLTEAEKELNLNLSEHEGWHQLTRVLNSIFGEQL
ncbi:hypothetical protein [Vreelandella populi]|uniref:hypothetical protein n=1 Tax=Vreelandella populi TaxID=2498858 RepID=UPI000F8D8E36|nr:hypothetical protein [Halomonas populi]RUR56354.1 hypothetical protein ELY40_04130 [Halomonas populi]